MDINIYCWGFIICLFVHPFPFDMYFTDSENILLILSKLSIMKLIPSLLPLIIFICLCRHLSITTLPRTAIYHCRVLLSLSIRPNFFFTYLLNFLFSDYVSVKLASMVIEFLGREN